MQNDQVTGQFVLMLNDARTSTAVTEAVLRAAARAFSTGFAGAFFVDDDGAPRPHVATSDLVQQADALQFGTGEGPATVMDEDAATVWSDDLATDPRWPHWGTAVTGLGLRSMICARMLVDGRIVGGLQIYSETPGRFGTTDAALCESYAHAAAVALHATGREEHFAQALRSRTVIGQAQGMLMERFDLDAPQAFGVLKRLSQAGNLKVSTIAEALTATGELPEVS